MKQFQVTYYEYGLTKMVCRNFFTELAAHIYAAYIRRTHGKESYVKVYEKIYES